MASRISHRSRRSSCSFSRLTRNMAVGTAAEARMPRMVTVTISSTSVSPRSPGRVLRFGFSSLIGVIPSLHANAYLPALRRQLLLGAVDGRGTGDDNGSLPGTLGLEAQRANGTRPGDARGPRRPRGVDGDVARTVFAMHQRHCLAVFAQQVALLNAHQRDLSRVVLDLQRDRG